MAQPSRISKLLKCWRKSKPDSDVANLDDTIERIIAGEPLRNEDPFLRMSKDVMVAMKYYMEVIGGNPSSYKRISSLYAYIRHWEVKRLLDSFDRPLSKNRSIANALATKGDEYFQDWEYGNALLCYNLAMSYAPPASQLLAEIYSKRANLFIEMNDLRLAWTDINVACLFPKLPFSLKLELKQQKDICVERDLEVGGQANVVKNTKNSEYAEQVIFQVEGEKNPIMPSAAACVEMRFTEKRGRHLVTTKDLKPCVTIIVEQPYVTVMTKWVTWEMKHCFTCYKRIWRTIACNSCVFAIYCSVNCRMTDYENGHKYLCPCLPYAHFAGIENPHYMALKAVCRAGPEYLFKVYKEKESPSDGKEKISSFIPGFDPTSGIYASDSHYQMEHLINHITDEGQLNELAFLAVSSAIALEAKSTFFAGVSELDQKGFSIFISCVLFSHLCTFCSNVFALKTSSDAGDPRLEYEIREFRSGEDSDNTSAMSGLFSLCSMLNHSCEPNAAWEQAKDGRFAIFTRQNLKAGDEILISYGVGYPESSLKERLEWSNLNYCFICSCIACELKWVRAKCIPLRAKFLCPKCRNSNYSRAVLNKWCWLKEYKDRGICWKCKRKFKMSTLIGEELKYSALLRSAAELISKHKYLKALPLVVECISYYQNNIRSPSRNFINSQACLSQIYENVIGL